MEEAPGAQGLLGCASVGGAAGRGPEPGDSLDGRH